MERDLQLKFKRDFRSARVGSMETQDIALMAHLLRRAGYGATRDELEEYASEGYEAVVEELFHPTDPQNMPDDLIRRYHVEQSDLRTPDDAAAYWMYRMFTTRCPLEEKIALFWHGLLATGYSKTNQGRSLLNQIDMFRRYGLGSFRTLLVELSMDPTMIVWLDNYDNHKGAINENYGRELLELFSMGVGNYTEQDIKECARAFTGWTLGMLSTWHSAPKKTPYGLTDASPGTSNTATTTTTTAKRLSWARPVGSTARM